mmetsp:Transcript_48655/g.136003  ORF Transcript_48655/g.136003 Transcript_48655/m.136003 type:complete len:115 (-) Transcript_48655:68-412(-)
MLQHEPRRPQREALRRPYAPIDPPSPLQASDSAASALVRAPACLVGGLCFGGLGPSRWQFWRRLLQPARSVHDSCRSFNAQYRSVLVRHDLRSEVDRPPMIFFHWWSSLSNARM